MEDLSVIGKDLYNSLKCKPHPLEKYIIVIDSNLDNDSLLRVIGEKIGIDLFDYDDAATEIYMKLKNYLVNEKSISETEKKINVTFTEYSKCFPELTDEEIIPLYYNRLLN